MTDSEARSWDTADSSRTPHERPPEAAPGPVPSNDRQRLHDQQRELVRASLIARSPREGSTHRHLA